jgi:hypothetical protein
MGNRALTVFADSDYLDLIALAHADLAAVLRQAGRGEEAIRELRSALELYEQKGHLVGANDIRTRLADLEGSGAPA